MLSTFALGQHRLSPVERPQTKAASVLEIARKYSSSFGLKEHGLLVAVVGVDGFDLEQAAKAAFSCAEKVTLVNVLVNGCRG